MFKTKSTEQIPFETLEQSVAGRFERMAGLFPDKEAITCQEQRITYKDLDRQASSLAERIKQSGTPAGQHALFLETGISQFAAILGILKSGAAYVPIDTSWPAHRIELAIKNSQPGVIITNNLNLGQVKALHDDKYIVNIDEPYSPQQLDLAASRPGPNDIIHIIYTSGSTGEPKGVFTRHRNQLHFVRRFSQFIHINPDDRFAYYFSIGFSAHAMPFLGILLNGGTLCIYDLKKRGFQGLAGFFKEEKITLALMIPSVLRHFRVTLDKNFRFPKLRVLLVGGETLYFNDVKLILPHLGKNAEIINIYASTEAYLARAYRMNRETVLKQNIIPIGYPIEGMEISIVNQDGEPCAINQVGEMILKSPYLARGYWRDKEQSDLHFSEENDSIIFRSRDLAYAREDGCIVHVGRKDAMVKIRGQRVDLGEIENSMLFNPDIQEVAVRVKESPAGDKLLLAYYVCREEAPIGEKELKTFLTRRLPVYMLPSYVIRLSELPKTESGKTDYNALPDPDWEKQSGKNHIRHPRTPTEEQLVAIFEKNLEIHPIGINDNILDTGQDSLKMFVAFDTVEKHFHYKIDIDKLTENPTIEALARSIDEASK
jgi:amino acid adenylation domain-containing protein